MKTPADMRRSLFGDAAWQFPHNIAVKGKAFGGCSNGTRRCNLFAFFRLTGAPGNLRNM